MSIDCEKFDSFDAEIRSNALKAFAAEYAAKAVKLGDKNNFTYIVMAVNKMKKGQYSEVIDTVNNIR